MRKLIISAPFGNYLRFNNTTPTLGTFTLHRRGSLMYRVWRLLKTLDYDFDSGSWYNNLGLPNPGIFSLQSVAQDCILSVCGFSAYEWEVLLKAATLLNPRAIELNLSCPNVVGIAPLPDLHDYPVELIAKLAPQVKDGDLSGFWYAYDKGIRHFHLCNSLKTEAGAMSGKGLKRHSLSTIRIIRAHEWMCDKNSKLQIIGGGGIASEADIDEYLEAGADRVAIASTLLNPFNWHKVSRLVQHLEGVSK